MTAKMAISMQSRVAGMPIDMSGYESLRVGCKGPFAEVRNEITICTLRSAVLFTVFQTHHTHVLPERKENNQLYAQHLQERPVMCQVSPELQVELDQAEHGNSDTGSLEDFDPYVRECWT